MHVYCTNTGTFITYLSCPGVGARLEGTLTYSRAIRSRRQLAHKKAGLHRHICHLVGLAPWGTLEVRWGEVDSDEKIAAVVRASQASGSRRAIVAAAGWWLLCLVRRIPGERPLQSQEWFSSSCNNSSRPQSIRWSTGLLRRLQPLLW